MKLFQQMPSLFSCKDIQLLFGFRRREMVSRLECCCPDDECPNCRYFKNCFENDRKITTEILFRLRCLGISVNSLLDTGKASELSILHCRCFVACLADNANLCQVDADAAQEAIRQTAPGAMRDFCGKGNYTVSGVAEGYADMLYTYFPKRNGRLRNEVISLASGEQKAYLKFSVEAFYSLRIIFGMDLDRLLDGNQPHRDLKSKIISCL